MAYNTPGVSINQVLTRVSQALADCKLLPCLVGPLNQVVKNSAVSITLPVSTSTTIAYPNIKVGAIVDTTSVKLKISNAVIEVVASASPITSIASMEVGGNTIVANSGTTFANAKIGDKFVLASGGEYTIKAKSTDSTTLSVVPVIYKAFTPSTDTFKVTRAYTEDIYATLTAPSYNLISFSFTGLTYDSCKIVGGSCYVSYVALRKDLTGFYEIDDADVLASDMEVDPLNPLGFYLGNVMLAANGGKTMYAYITSDNLDATYLAAFEDLATRRDMYFIIPMSTSSTVTAGLKSHVSGMSDPDVSFFRSGLISTPLVTEKKLTSVTFAVGTHTANAPVTITRTDSNSGFLTAGVRVGNEIDVTTIDGNPISDSNYIFEDGSDKALLPGIDYNEILVTEIVSEGSVKFAPYLNGVQLTNYKVAPEALKVIGFDVIYYYTKDEQVDLIVAKASSYASKRMLLVWPPEAIWNDGNGGTITFDGTALCAALAAAMSTYAAQQSFTNLTFAGPKSLKYSNTYFNSTQLKRLSAGGVFVLVQDAEDAEIYARHQKTTSTVSDEEGEFSITKAVDKFSLDVWDLFHPFIGKFNVTEDLLTQLSEVLDTYVFTAKNTKAAYCGSLILSSKDISIKANIGGKNTTITKGKVAVAITIEVGYPANFIEVTIYVS